MSQEQCYNKGCGQKFDSANNEENCEHHPGAPVFHDVIKKWSCCGKRSRDFTEFLGMKGCTIGHHSNIKPIVPNIEKKNEEADNLVTREIIPDPIISKKVKKRPDENEPKVPLQVTVTSSAKSALEKKLASLQLDEQNIENCEASIIRPGAPCKHNGCTATYKNGCSDQCCFHPGCPVFHEGCKFWSCCNVKRIDFSDFLAQQGCTNGNHSWTTKEDENKKRVDCRFDHFQTGNNMTINVYAKAPVPDKCIVKVNQVAVDIDVMFEGGLCNFVKKFVLAGTIDPLRSSVKLIGTKIEITLRKADIQAWKSLEFNK